MKKIRKIGFIFIICFSIFSLNTCGFLSEWIITKQQILEISFSQYAEMKDEYIAGNKLITSGAQYNMIQEIGNAIKDAAEDYLMDTEGNLNRLSGFEWEFILVNEDTVNAWCMPGGKIAFYTGILPYCKTDAGVAVVMGHEAAHAILDHGRKKMSQAIMAQLGGEVVNLVFGSDFINLAYSLGVNLGVILVGSREKEHEADDYGLKLCAIAGYDPDVAGDFWREMNGGSSSGVGSLLEFLSTHPDSLKRAGNLDKAAPEKKKLARSSPYNVTEFKNNPIPGIR